MKNGKLIRWLFAASVLIAFCLVNSSAFSKVNTYEDGNFADVAPHEWYVQSVKGAYEYGFLLGDSGTTFSPDGTLTVAEIITVMSRVRANYYGEETDRDILFPVESLDNDGSSVIQLPENATDGPDDADIPFNASDLYGENDGSWFLPYLDYALTTGFVKEGQFDDYDRPAKRHEVASIVKTAMKEDYYTPINDIDMIADVAEEQPYFEDVLCLYRAGIFAGSDDYGNFRPEDTITRAETAAVIIRVAFPERRIKGQPDKISNDDAYLLTSITSYAGYYHVGTASGWLLDNRGGYPKTTPKVVSGIVSDASTEAGTAVIREFNKTTTGKIVLEAEYSILDNPEGAYIAYCNENEQSVYRIEVIDGAWRILGSDGSGTLLRQAAAGDKYILHITVDLDNARSTTVINGVNYGVHPLMTDDSNVMTLRFGSTEAGTPTAGPGNVDMYVNYAVYNKFSFDPENETPYGWTGDGTVKDDLLELLPNGSAEKAFDPVSGTVIAETEMLIDSSTRASYALKSGEKTVVLMRFDGVNINVNGEDVYAYYDGLWYRFRFELDTVAGKVLIKVNGRDIATVDMMESATSVDRLEIENAGDTVLLSDNYKVFREQKHDDYVPAPVRPAGEEKYTVGMNICSIWQEGSHFGWATISPYDRPVLGYYDEGNKESADWEIKYMVEHGIDFQAFCWYPDQSDTYLKSPKLAAQLHDGYMNAEYSNEMKYCLLWEVGSSKKPDGMDAFKQYFVPYMIENYFKDPRYMTIDNKPVLCFFAPGGLAAKDALGSDEALKEALDYLREEVEKLGFDGLIVIGNPSQEKAAAYGFDGIYAYSWGYQGYLLETNKTRNLMTADGSPYTVPTISVGYNVMPWLGTRYPMISGEDYAAAHKWVKEEYLPTYAEEDWQKNFVMLSTWNEYGEGTFIMPGEQNGGFTYLDAIREAYTDEEADESVDTIPSTEQLRRIGRMYPQYRRHMRDLGYSEMAGEAEAYKTVYEVDFTKATSAAVFSPAGLEDIRFDAENGMSFTSKTADSYFFLNFSDPLKLDELVGFRITANIPGDSNYSEFFFVTKQSPGWAQTKSVQLYAPSGKTDTYTLLFNKNVWKGDMTQFRVDLLLRAGISGSVKKIEFLADKSDLSKDFYINGMKYVTRTNGKILDNGIALAAFDPEIAMDYGLNTFALWDKETGVLTLNLTDHTVVYTVGSDRFTVDGVERNLGYEMYLEDGLPMIDFEGFCNAVGYNYSLEDGVIRIDTPQKDYFTDYLNRDPGAFEFNTPNLTDGWSSSHFNLSVGTDGILHMEPIVSIIDVVMTNKLDKPIVTQNYNAVKIRMKHEIDTAGDSWGIYFATQDDPYYSESKCIRSQIGKDSDGEFIEYTVDLSKKMTWTGTVTNLRFDPFDAHGWCDLDYIRFYYDDNFDPPLDAREDDPEAQFFGKFDTFEVVNGDAEGEGGFTSSNGELSIVVDPDDEDNKCFFVKPKDDKIVYTLASQSIRFNKGAVYQLDVDLKLGAHGTNTELPPDFTAHVLASAVYADPSRASNTHVVGRKLNIKASDGWVHLTCEFQVSKGSYDRSLDSLQFYADPVSEKGIGFYFDNVVVTETYPEESEEEAFDEENEFVLVNPDAEGEQCGFTKTNGTVSIVTDPEDEDNRCYFVKPVDDRSVWLNAGESVQLVNGATYRVDMDVKVGSSGTQTKLSPNFKGHILLNMSYDGSSHVVGRVLNLSVADGWAMLSCEFTVVSYGSEKPEALFQIYTDPIDGKGVGFYFDNVTITKCP